jgi:branched-chain amino acid transport system permease protein
MRSKTFKESYREDIKIFDTIWSKFWLSLFLAAMLSLPMWADPYIVYMTNIAGIAAIAAIGLNILTGFTGQISLGHAAFVAIGAYTTAVLAATYGVPFWAAIPAGGFMASLFGVLLGFPCLRLKGLYLAMATMSFGVVAQYVVTHWEGLTMGVRGLSVPAPDLFGFSLFGESRFYYVMLFFVAFTAISAKNIMRTRVGRAFVAIRDRDIAASVIGVNLTKYKVMAFAISSFFGGLAGGLYSYSTGYLHPENFTLLLSVEYIGMIIIGGLGSILGSIMGAVFLTVMQDIIKGTVETIALFIPALKGVYDDEWSIAALGLLIIIFLIVEPSGLNGIWIKIRNYFNNWPFKY